MARARCFRHCLSLAEADDSNAVVAVEPTGYPEAAVCGRGDAEHDAPGMVVLTESEWNRYDAGQRAFELDDRTGEVELEPSAAVPLTPEELTGIEPVDGDADYEALVEDALDAVPEVDEFDDPGDVDGEFRV